MPKSSLEELKAQVSAGRYALDFGRLAEDILAKFALIRRVRRQMIGETNGAPPGAAAWRKPPSRRRARPAKRPDLPTRRARLRKEPPQ